MQSFDAAVKSAEQGLQRHPGNEDFFRLMGQAEHSVFVAPSHAVSHPVATTASRWTETSSDVDEEFRDCSDDESEDEFLQDDIDEGAMKNWEDLLLHAAPEKKERVFSIAKQLNECYKKVEPPGSPSIVVSLVDASTRAILVDVLACALADLIRSSHCDRSQATQVRCYVCDTAVEGWIPALQGVRKAI